MKPEADFPKRQHFVPELLQSGFADADGCLWYFDRRRKDGVDRTGTGNLFVEGHLYTTEDAEGTRRGTIESLLSKVETAVAPVLERVVARARLRRPPDLVDEDRWIVLLFMYLQHRRVPDFFRQVPFDRPLGEEIAEIVRQTEAERGPLDPAVRDTYLSPALAKRLEQNFRASGVFGDLANSPSFRRFNARDISAAVLDRPGASLILGSYPVARTSVDGRTDLDHSGVEMWMPIAPDVALGLAGPQGRSTIALVGAGPWVRNLNNYIRDRSTVIASPSRYLVEVLSKKMTGPVVQSRFRP